MKKIICVILLFAFTFSARGQQRQPVPEQDDVVRISSNLVQVDALVKDKDGSQITDLKADDFELYQDGKLQKITNFSYVNAAAPKQKANAAEAKKSGKNAPVPPPVRVTPNNVGRVLTFVIDDGNCHATRAGMTAAREGLEKFISEQMQPNDLTAIYQTRGGSSLLQQYTSDKSRLLETVRKIRWYPQIGTCGGDGTGEIFETARDNSTLNPRGQGTFENDRDRTQREKAEDTNKDIQTVGTLGVLRYVVSGLAKISGRKTVFFMSDGMTTRDRNGSQSRAFDALRDLTDLANRASVVFNVIDDRGVTLPGATAADNLQGGSGDILAKRSDEIRDSRDGLFFLANETSGNFYKEANFLDVPLRKALNAENGYYLLAYQPEGDTFKNKKFHKIEIKLKRPDLKVSSRAGFYGVTNEASQPKKRTGDSELYDAVAAPLPNAGLNLRLSAFFANTATEGDFVRAMIYVGGKDISFADEPNGRKKAVFDVVAVTLDEKNQVIDDFNRTHTIHLSADDAAKIQRNGLIYAADVPVKKAGTYSFRTAIRDESSRQIGAASQVIEVPDLKKGRLYLSGLFVSAVDANGKYIAPAAAKPENAFSLPASVSVPAIRQFRRGAILAYAYTLYNAQTDKTANQPKLTVKLDLYRDGELISKGQPQAAQLEKQDDLTRVKDYGYLHLKPEIPTGDYALFLTVTDTLTNQSVSQWIDFEVVN